VSDVFLDTVGLLALLNYSDQWRLDAITAFDALQAAHRGVVTTDLVFYEAGNALARTPLRIAVDNLRGELRDQGRIEALTVADCEGAWQVYRSRHPGDPGIVDCISFAVMRRLGLTDVFTNDQHFAAAGFNVLF
jgi:predicted nucleic acid-binding protein